MKIRGNKSAFIYKLLSASAGPIVITLFRGINIDRRLALVNIILIILISIVLGFVFIKEVEINDEHIVIKKYLLVKRSVEVCKIKNIEILRGIVAIYTIDGITFKLNSAHLNKVDFKEFNNKYINNETLLTSPEF